MMRHLGFFFVFASLGVSLYSCSLGGPLRRDPKANSYTIGALPQRWEKQQLESNADYTWFNPKRGSIIALSSVCQRYEEVSLEALTKDLISPLENPEVLWRTRGSIDERDAEFTRAKGKMDGVSVECSYVTMKKNNCIFDFSLYSKDKIDAEDDKDFMAFVKSFHFSGQGAGIHE